MRAMAELVTELPEVSRRLALAKASAAIKAQLRRVGLLQSIGAEWVFASTEAAVAACTVFCEREAAANDRPPPSPGPIEASSALRSIDLDGWSSAANAAAWPTSAAEAGPSTSETAAADVPSSARAAAAGALPPTVTMPLLDRTTGGERGRPPLRLTPTFGSGSLRSPLLNEVHLRDHEWK